MPIPSPEAATGPLLLLAAPGLFVALNLHTVWKWLGGMPSSGIYCMHAVQVDPTNKARGLPALWCLANRAGIVLGQLGKRHSAIVNVAAVYAQVHLPCGSGARCCCLDGHPPRRPFPGLLAAKARLHSARHKRLSQTKPSRTTSLNIDTLVKKHLSHSHCHLRGTGSAQAEAIRRVKKTGSGGHGVLQPKC